MYLGFSHFSKALRSVSERSPSELRTPSTIAQRTQKERTLNGCYAIIQSSAVWHESVSTTRESYGNLTAKLSFEAVWQLHIIRSPLTHFEPLICYPTY